MRKKTEDVRCLRRRIGGACSAVATGRELLFAASFGMLWTFAPDGGVTHHGAGEFALDEDDNLIVSTKEEAAVCEALQP